MSKLSKLIPIEKESIPVEEKSMKEAINAVNRGAKLDGFSKIVCGDELDSPKIISTGIIGLDYNLQIGGFPRGRIVQIYGAEASFKSTIALRTVAEAQKGGAKVLWVDAEMGFDINWAKANGVDMKKIGIMKPDNQIEGLDTITNAIKDGDWNVVVLDSLIALAPQKESGDSKKNTVASIDVEAMGVFARKMSQWFRNNVKYISKHGILFIIINQLRMNISGYGNPEVVPGGNAVKYYSSINLGIKKLKAKDDQIKDKNDNIVGAKYQYIIDKTRFDTYGKTGQFTVYGNIIDNYSMLRDIALKEGIIEKLNASYYQYGETKINGLNNVAKELIKNKQMCSEIEAKIREKMGFNVNSFDPYAMDIEDTTSEE